MDAERIQVGFGITTLIRGLNGNGVDGIGSYTLELSKTLRDISDIELSTYMFNNRNMWQAIPANTLKLDSFPCTLLKDLMYSDTEKQLKKQGVKLIHATDHLIPIVRKIPLIATIMDAIPLTHPEWVTTSAISKIKFKLWREIARRSDHIITISSYSKAAITEHFDIPPQRISVIPLGVDQRFFDRIPLEYRMRTLSKYNLTSGFLISIGTLQPRKNIGLTLAAMRLLPSHIRRTHPLVIVGRSGWGCNQLQNDIQNAEKEGWCRWLSHVPDHELRALLQSAYTMIFPSLAEGFGLPVLEAFASNLPVITSNTTSLPEVAGNAALLIDPTDPYALADAILNLVENAELTVNLSQLGWLRAQEFSWAKCASETSFIYKRVLIETN